MTSQERSYMGDGCPDVAPPVTGEGDAAFDAIRTKLQLELKQSQEQYSKLAASIRSLKRELASESKRREAAEAEAAANLKALAKSKLILQKQGEALIAEHYGPSKYKLLIVARALLLTMPFIMRKSDHYSVDEDNFNKCCASWFDDLDKEMRGVACDSNTSTPQSNDA